MQTFVLAFEVIQEMLTPLSIDLLHKLKIRTINQTLYKSP